MNSKQESKGYDVFFKAGEYVALIGHSTSEFAAQQWIKELYAAWPKTGVEFYYHN